MGLDVAAIRAQVKRLEQLVPDEPRWWRPIHPPWSERRLRRFEAAHFALPADYRAWLATVGDGGLLLMDAALASWQVYGSGFSALAKRKADELAAAKRPFRGRECNSVSHPISGVLEVGCYCNTDTHYLVVTGKRAGEVWIESVYGGFLRQGVFSDYVDNWLKASTEYATEQVRVRDPAELVSVAANDRIWHFNNAGLVPWLRAGPEPMVQAFRDITDAETRERAWRALQSAYFSHTDHFIASPALAASGATALLGIVEVVSTRFTELDHVLGAIFDAEPPNISETNVARLVATIATDPKRANWYAKWAQTALVAEGRLAEAIALLAVQPYRQSGDWYQLARACMARGGETLAAFHRMYAASGCSTFLEDLDAGRDAGVKPSIARDYVAWVFSNTADLELVALLYGIAGDGAHMIDAAIRALSVGGVQRDLQECANHTAHLRIGRALTGTIERAPPIAVNYGAHTPRAKLVETLLAHTGELGIEVVRDP